MVKELDSIKKHAKEIEAQMKYYNLDTGKIHNLITDITILRDKIAKEQNRGKKK